MVQMDLKLKIDPVIRITVVLILFSCFCLSGAAADAFRQTRPHTITPQPGPPAYAFNDSSFYKWSGSEVIKAFIENGLEAVNIKKGLTMGLRLARETTIFLIPSSGENIGGVVSGYGSPKALEEDRKFYSRMNKPSAPPAWRIFQRKNILLLISGKVPEEKAVLYREALKGM